MEVGIDRIQLGINIRKEHKKRNMTLEELANGICSIGKMSNIENGTTDIHLDDLKLIANKIGMPYKELLPNNHDNHIILHLFEEVEITHAINAASEALLLIQRIEQNFEDELKINSSLQLELNYLKGKTYFLLDDDLKASTIFYQISKNPITSQRDVVVVAKSEHKLGELYAKNLHYRKAIEHMNTAAEHFQKHKLSVPWKILYNLAILHLYLKQYEKSSVYLTLIKRKNPKLSYIDSLVHLLTGNYKGGIEMLHSIKKELVEVDDTETLLKSIIATLYFSSFSPLDYKMRTETLYEFIENDVAEKQLTDRVQIKYLLLSMQSIILNLLVTTDITKVGDRIELLMKLEQKYDFLEYHHITLFLKARYKSIKGDKSSEVDEILEEAQAIMKNNKINSIVLFAILYERSLINDDPHSFAFKALKMATEYSNLDTLNPIQFEHFMPNLTSI